MARIKLGKILNSKALSCFREALVELVEASALASEALVELVEASFLASEALVELSCWKVLNLPNSFCCKLLSVKAVRSSSSVA